MLTQIYIRDLATIEKLELNFSAFSTMITGETGAGKSIFIEAIELGLGGRISSSLIRPGKDKAEIEITSLKSQAEEMGAKAAHQLLFNRGGQSIADSIRNATK